MSNDPIPNVIVDEATSMLKRLGNCMEQNRKLLALAKKGNEALLCVAEIEEVLDDAGIPRTTPHGVNISTTWRVKELARKVKVAE